LTEAAVFGLKAGNEAAKYALQNSKKQKEKPSELYLREKYFFNNQPEISNNPMADTRNKLCKTMDDKVGILRNENDLRSALDDIERWHKILKAYRPNGYPSLLDKEQLSLMLAASQIITQAAIDRKISIGSHFRTDIL